MQNAYHHRAVHEHVLLMTLEIADVPRLDESQRVTVTELPEGFVRVQAHYGFMEKPSIPDIIARDDTPTPPMEYTTFFLGRETVLAENGEGMWRWRKVLFAFMTRNSQRATSFFAVPADRVMEVGSVIRL
jgi:KUP system potassium uptake protein